MRDSCTEGTCIVKLNDVGCDAHVPKKNRDCADRFPLVTHIPKHGIANAIYESESPVEQNTTIYGADRAFLVIEYRHHGKQCHPAALFGALGRHSAVGQNQWDVRKLSEPFAFEFQLL